MLMDAEIVKHRTHGCVRNSTMVL